MSRQRLSALVSEFEDAIRTLRSRASEIDPNDLMPVHDMLRYHLEYQSEFEQNASRLPALARELDSYQDSLQNAVRRLPMMSRVVAAQTLFRLYNVAMEYGLRLRAERQFAFGPDYDYLDDLIATLQSGRDVVRPDVGRASREADGSLAEFDLASQFHSVAEREERRANLFRLSAIVVVLAAGAGIFFWTLSHDGDITTSTVLQKLSLGIPALTMFAYLTSQSRSHREHAHHHSAVALRLDTIGAYTNRLDPPQRNDLLVHFGRSLFVSVGSNEAGSQPEQAGTMSIDELLSVLQRLRQLGLDAPGTTP
ncbi:MAG: hypothetical protein Q8M22_14000 [Actinomycetota bacterium]|nr:hypothetical protein [Actinomycetota bacterium]